MSDWQELIRQIKEEHKELEEKRQLVKMQQRLIEVMQDKINSQSAIIERLVEIVGDDNVDGM